MSESTVDATGTNDGRMDELERVIRPSSRTVRQYCHSWWLARTTSARCCAPSSPQ